jgi:hypothetical protein
MKTLIGHPVNEGRPNLSPFCCTSGLDTIPKAGEQLNAIRPLRFIVHRRSPHNDDPPSGTELYRPRQARAGYRRNHLMDAHVLGTTGFSSHFND